VRYHQLDREEFFWQHISDNLKSTYGAEAKLLNLAPLDWTKPQILGFIDHFAEELANLCDHPENARQCGINPTPGKHLEMQLTISYSTFRRIFKIQQRANVSISIKNRFAIFCGKSWGCKGFEDYLYHYGCEDAHDRQEDIDPSQLQSDTATQHTLSSISHYETDEYSLPFTSYNTATWVGRDKEIAGLYHAYQNRYRIISLLGITGVGKTALTEKLIHKIFEDKRPDSLSLWIEDYYNEQQHEDFIHFAHKLITALKIPAYSTVWDPDRLIESVVTYLKNHRCIVIINSLEYILHNDQENYVVQFQDDTWQKFFLHICKAHSFESLILLTSQLKSSELTVLQSRYESRVYQQSLRGLNQEESLELFGKRGIGLQNHYDQQSYLVRIATVFSGHPLALGTIASEIIDDFQGDIASFWASYGSEIVKAEKSKLEESNAIGYKKDFSLHDWSIKQRENIENRIENTFERLKNAHLNAYLLLITISYKPVLHKSYIISHMKRMQLFDPSEIERALTTLVNRFLLTKKKDVYEQHDLIRSVSQKHLKRMDRLYH